MPSSSTATRSPALGARPAAAVPLRAAPAGRRELSPHLCYSDPQWVAAGLELIKHLPHSACVISVWSVDPAFVTFEFGQDIVSQKQVHNLRFGALGCNLTQSSEQGFLLST